MVSRRQVSGELRERFYQSVAETLSLLRAAPGPDRQLTLLHVSETLAATMDLPLVWIGRREPNLTEVSVLAAAGPAKEYASALRLSSDEREPGGRGPAGIVLREESARVIQVAAAEFAPWQATARRYAFGACIVAVSRTHDRGQLVLATYSRAGGPAFGEELLDWAQRLVDELSRFWDHQVLLERSHRLSRYRDAQRTIQRALLEQPDPEALYRTLAHALAEIAGAAAVDVFAADGDNGMLRRVELIGPIADIVRGWPLPPQHEEGPDALAPTLAFMHGKPVLRRHSPGAVQVDHAWCSELLGHAGAMGCWPLFALPHAVPDQPPVPAGVFVVVTTEVDAFDEEMCRLLDEIADAAGRALGQHAQRHALLQEQERQTYLAAHDDLTGLPNRRALERYLDTVLARARRGPRRLAVGMLDLDDLKPINDSLGHATGDAILVEVADRLRHVLRDNDYVARLGGDEFVLVLENFEHDADLESLLERVGTALQRPMTIDNEVMSVGASLGVAMYSSEAHISGEQLLRRADQAMYQVKARKQHRLRWWSMTLPDGALEETAERDVDVAAYGERAAVVLSGCHEAWLPRLPAVADSFYSALLEHEGVGKLLGVLPEAEYLSLKGHVLQHLQMLIRPDLDQATHRERATRSGMFHAACGMEEVWLLEAVEILRDVLGAALSRADHHARELVRQRLAVDRQWQLESMRELQRMRVTLLARLNALAWSAEGYLELIQGVVDIL
ncbi:MAG: diguanylate cyclase, partial [Rhodanobacter sp.]